MLRSRALRRTVGFHRVALGQVLQNFSQPSSGQGDSLRLLGVRKNEKYHAFSWGKEIVGREPERGYAEPLRLLDWRDATACAGTTQQDH
jgi:hypothetical protein